MNTNALAVAVAAKAAAITGIRGTSAVLTDTVPATPWAIVGAHQGVNSGGNIGQRSINYTFPIRVYVERTSDAGRVQTMLNDLVDAFVVAYEAGITLGGTVAKAEITSWNTDLYAEVAGGFYQVVELTLTALVRESSAYTP